jgi:hypothetical protein
MLGRKEAINFGPLACSADGLTYRQKLYSWDRVLSANLESGRLVISIKDGDRDRALRIPAKAISNPDLCAQLVRNMEY